MKATQGLTININEIAPHTTGFISRLEDVYSSDYYACRNTD